MREILFRGKAVNLHNGSKDFVYGQYVQNRDGKMIYSDTWEDGKQKHYVIEETVGQYTGLTDRNDKKIFEGDIVKVYARGYHTICTVSWAETVAHFQLWQINTIPNTPTALNLGNYDCEVIGNIHDNPELLKGGTNG